MPAQMYIGVRAQREREKLVKESRRRKGERDKKIDKDSASVRW